ncbi:MAG: DUF1788 domain-containing protein [Candidatus Sericytochromatia bacterium]
MKIENISNKFEELCNKIKDKHFLEMKALGGEIPFYITSYNPKQHVEVEKNIKLLKKNLQSSGIEVLEINMYKLCLDILIEQDLLNSVLEMEKSMPKENLLDSLQGILDIENTLVPVIYKMLDESNCKVVFITSIGNVYPYIRAHNILNNIQSIIKKVPMVLFFPGEYDSLSLKLFGLLKDNNYYRAFNLDALKFEK